MHFCGSISNPIVFSYVINRFQILFEQTMLPTQKHTVTGDQAMYSNFLWLAQNPKAFTLNPPVHFIPKVNQPLAYSIRRFTPE